ncbi:hypothetical protein GQ55_1G330300 [Panicum hallii var. hallii]|uniref:Uncharacterized protein n=1 Tax=Panicum hallii var. hallii TaxID=1504633 RepID=A0A2T7FA34_9POAL|nr:hypothetical protein GQ55_1G330300 [Panicum hallii var. hallii]
MCSAASTGARTPALGWGILAALLSLATVALVPFPSPSSSSSRTSAPPRLQPLHLDADENRPFLPLPLHKMPSPSAPPNQPPRPPARHLPHHPQPITTAGSAASPAILLDLAATNPLSQLKTLTS